MDLLEEMLRCRDEYERHNKTSCNVLNENIDRIITEGMQKRRG